MGRPAQDTDAPSSAAVVRRELARLRRRLHEEYRDRAPAEELDRLWVDAERTLASARISRFVPILVEREVREVLRHRHGGAAPR